MTSQWAKSCLKIPIPYHATSKKVIECEWTLLSLACSRRAWPLPVLQSEEWLNKIFSFCLMLANITIKVVRYSMFDFAWHEKEVDFAFQFSQLQKMGFRNRRSVCLWLKLIFTQLSWRCVLLARVTTVPIFS